MENPDILAEIRDSSKSELKQEFMNELVKRIRMMMIIRHCTEDNEPHEVIPGLFIGSIGASLNKTLLKQVGITHILCVADNIEPAFPNDFTYKLVKILDSPDVDLKPHLQSCFEFIGYGLAAGKILVHW